jgi:Transposase, Mutator family
MRARWELFTPFLAFPAEVRKVIYTTNLIESMNARLRKVTATAAGPVRAGRPQSPLPGRPEPGGVPPPQRGDPQLGVESGTPAHLGTNLHPAELADGEFGASEPRLRAGPRARPMTDRPGDGPARRG